MRWFDPLPSLAQQEYWGVRLAGQAQPQIRVRVNWWPYPGTERVNPAFRLEQAFQTSASPLTWWFTHRLADGFNPNDYPTFVFAAQGQLIAKEPGELQLTIPANEDGFSLLFEVRSTRSLPMLGVPGVWIRHRLRRSASQWIEDQWYWPAAGPTFRPRDAVYYGNIQAINFRAIGTAWGWQSNALFFQAMPDCYDFPDPDEP